ncbi:MAG: oligosaccharide flippase family protein, partial [Chloroflexota bacterium]|nr:oligosaccharide flippase family protein [Chloroflexota bacterium]
DGATALTILAWANLVNTGTGICGVLLDMSGNTKLKLVNSIVTVILNIGLNILFIPIWGLIGAAIAALVAAVTVNLLRLFEVFFVVRMHPYNISFLKPIFAAITAWAILLIFRSFAFDLNNPIFLALNILTLLGVYIAALLLLGLSQEDRAVLNRLYRRAVSMWPRQK